ncbi:hypothetical protein C7B79_11245, partial [Chroococcidiopsis cubana CCALA 043]
MTPQIPDRFLYHDESYILVAVYGKGLITPQQYEMQTRSISTGCRRGFCSTYEVTNDALFLTEMVIGIVENGYRPIQGIMPERSSNTNNNYFEHPTYKGLRLLAPFTGRIRLGKDFIENVGYVYGQDPKDIDYKILLEFTFDAGKLVSVQDLSASNAKKRDNNSNLVRLEQNRIARQIAESLLELHFGSLDEELLAILEPLLKLLPGEFTRL